MVSEKARKLAGTDGPPPICRRLESVRRYFGHTSLRSFWLELDDGWDEEEALSYEAVRKYHGKREPPVRYVARVSEVFGVRLAWLISEEGEMLKPDRADGREAFADRLADRYPDFRRLDPGTQSLVVQLAGEYLRTAPDWREAGKATLDEMVELAGDLLWWATLPLRWHPWDHVWGTKGAPDRTTLEEERTFAASALAALRQIIMESGEGRPLEHAERSLLRRLRNQMEGEAEEGEAVLAELAEDMPDGEISRLE